MTVAEKTEKALEIAAEMDAAMPAAREDLADNVIANGGKAKDVANWVKRNYPKVGYKRLCRILMALAD